MFDAIDPIAVEPWKVILVLVGVPVLYVAKSFLPWSKRLWVDGDHAAFTRVHSTIIILHWGTTAVVAALVIDGGYDLGAVGVLLPENPLVTVVTLGFVSVAFGIYAVTALRADPIAVENHDLEPWQQGTLPATAEHRWVTFVLSATAGVCEEFVFRGFALLALLGLGVSLPVAVILSSASFVFVHGLAALNPFAAAAYFGFGIAFASGFLWFGSLLPVVGLHAGYDALAFAVKTKKYADHDSEPSQGVSPT